MRTVVGFAGIAIVIHDENPDPEMDLALLHALLDQRWHWGSYPEHCGNYPVGVNLLQWTQIVICEQQCGQDLVDLAGHPRVLALYEARRCFAMRNLVLTAPSFVRRLRRLFDERVCGVVLRSQRVLLLVSV